MSNPEDQPIANELKQEVEDSSSPDSDKDFFLSASVEDQSSDDTEFAVLSKCSEDEERGSLSEENDFSILNEDVVEETAIDSEHNLCDNKAVEASADSTGQNLCSSKEGKTSADITGKNLCDNKEVEASANVTDTDLSEKEIVEASVFDADRNLCDKEVVEVSAGLTDVDLSDTEQELEQDQNVDVPRSMDIYVNVAPARQRSAFYRQKVRRIEKILGEDPVNVSELRQQAISQGGLLSAELRRRAWPILLNLNISNIAPKPDEEILKNHKDYIQVVMDVNRSIKRFPPGMEEVHRLSLQDRLVDVIMRVLVRHPELHYYQGFHDICVTFLLVVDEDLAFGLVEKLALSHLRDFMEPTMDRTQQLLDYVPPLLRRANPELHHYLEGAELGNVFCISWLLTWFGHVLNNIESILRIYDFFIACHPLMPVYVMGAVVLYREKEIYATDQEMSSLYQLLTRVPDNLPFEHLLSSAGDLYLQYPPTELANEAIRRFKRAQEQAAARKAQVTARQQGKRKSSSFLLDGNVTFTKVTCWMLGAVVSVAVYALYTGMEWDWTPLT